MSKSSTHSNPNTEILASKKLAPGELTHIAMRGAFWNIGLAVANKVFTLIGQFLLAWILTPKDMGLAGMAIAMAGIVAFINASGVSDVLIQRGRYKTEAAQGFWLSLFLSLSTTVLILCLSPIATRIGHPELSQMLLILALLPISDALSPILSAGLKTDLNFKYVAISNFFSGVTYTVCAVFCALMGMGAYSLILPVIPRSLVNWGVMLSKTGIPNIEKPQYHFIKKLIRPSLSISITGFLNALQQQAPIFCVGLVTNFTVTGHFSWGWMVASQSVFLLAVNLRQVLMPTLIKIGNDPNRQAAAAFRAIRAMTALLTIACGLQALLAQPILDRFFPIKWSESAPVITWISLGLIFQGVYVCLSSWLNAAGRYKELLFVTILPVLLASGGAYFGAIHMGSEGASRGTAFGLFLSSVVSLEVIPLTILKDQLYRLVFPLFISLTTWTILFLSNTSNNNLIQSILFSFLFLFVSTLSWWYWSKEMFLNIWKSIFLNNYFYEVLSKKTQWIKTNKVPNFFIVGAPRCGTTALTRYLGEHPNIFISPIKEPYYFDFDLSKPSKMSQRNYFSLFSKSDPNLHKAIGEASTSYLFSRRAVPEILNFSPEAKIIVMLRNPIDLIQSLHSLNVLMGIENIFDFEKAWGAEKERKGGKNLPMFCTEPKILLYSEWGKLGEQMERLLSHVKKGNLKIIIFDEFIKNTRQVYEEVLSFLGVPKDGRTKFTVINENRQINQTWLQIVFSFLIYYGLIIRAKFGINKRLGGFRTILSLSSKPIKRTPISDKFRNELNSFFRNDVKKLSRLLKRDLSSWVSVKNSSQF